MSHLLQRKCRDLHALMHTSLCFLYLTISDRLDELERDKARLSEQLISQQRDAMAREMDMLRKR